MSLRRKIAYWFCPSLKAEIEALGDGNTRVVLENGRLLDEIAALKRLDSQQHSAKGE